MDALGKPLCVRRKTSRKKKTPGLTSIRGNKGSNRHADPDSSCLTDPKKISAQQSERLPNRVSWVSMLVSAL